MRVLFWGTYDTGKPRVRILREGLRANGADVQEIHASIWEGIEDKSQVRGLLVKSRLLLRWMLSYPMLVWRLLRAPRPDVVLVSYPGIIDIFVAAPIARLRGIPLAWDIFLSIYDTVCDDRRMLRPEGIPARILWKLEQVAIRRADIPFMDTQAHARRVEKLFNLPEKRCGSVWVGVEAERFPRRPEVRANVHKNPAHVLFYGQFIPLHGIDTIIAAARLLRDEPIRWILIGQGQEAGRIREILASDPLPRLEWTDWVDYAELEQHIAAADLCLGIFGMSPKAASVIPNKVFQIVAAGRPLITRDSPAARELISHAPPCAYLVAAGDPHALADAVLAHSNARPRPGSAACHAGLVEKINTQAIGRQFLDMFAHCGNQIRS